MRLTTLSLALGLLTLTTGEPAQAADWNNGAGGLKDYGTAGTPIPAPIPYQETFKWYLRADVGGGMTSEPDISERGMRFGLDRDPLDGTSFGMDPSWFRTTFDTFAQGGVGVGAYITPNIRADVTIDARTKSEITADATYSYVLDPVLVAPNRRVNGVMNDKTDARATVMLANVYWDLVDRSNRFVPYVGVGVGAAVRTLERKHQTIERVFDTNTGQPTGSVTSFTGKAKAHQLAPAAAATVGMGYALGPDMVIDLNYRYTYIGEVDFSNNIAFSNIIANTHSGAVSKMTVGAVHEHALRAGIRWNIW